MMRLSLRLGAWSAALFLVLGTGFVPSVAYADACYTTADCQQVGGTCANIDPTTQLGTCTGGTTVGGSTGGTVNTVGGSTGVSTGSLYNPLGTGTTLWTLVNNILAFIIKVGAVVVVFMIVYVGFLFVTAQGNETKLSAAKNALLWTIVGAVILLGAQVISQGVCTTVQALFPGGSLTCSS